MLGFLVSEMHSLLDLKKLFDKNNIKIVDFDGACLNTKQHGRWGLAHGEYRQNGEIRTRKEIDAMVKA
jgi:hypothetical protein